MVVLPLRNRLLEKHLTLEALAFDTGCNVLDGLPA